MNVVYDQSWSATLENSDQIITIINPMVTTTFGSNSYVFEIESWNGGIEIKSKEKVGGKEEVLNIELYEEDLCVLKEVLQYLNGIFAVTGVADVEIRIRLANDDNIWAVVGYGEAGDPAIIRFENSV